MTNSIKAPVEESTRVSLPKDQFHKEPQVRKDTPRGDQPIVDKSERQISPKQSLMSVSPPQVKLTNKPVSPERPKPPVAIAPKSIVAPKTPAAKSADDVRTSAKGHQGKEQVKNDHGKHDSRGGNDSAGSAPKQETAKTNRPERPKLNRPDELS